MLSMLVLTAAPAEAQLCSGAPSFRGRPYQARVLASFATIARGVGGSLAIGGDSRFARGGAGFVYYPDLDLYSTDASGLVGADLPVTRSRRVFVCPMATFGVGSGPPVMGIDVSAISVAADGHAGVIAFQTARLMIVPTLSLSAGYTHVTADFGPDFEEASVSDRSSGMDVGVGFIFSQAIGIRPILGFPLSGGDPGFSIALSVNFVR